MAELFHYNNSLVFGRTDHATRNLALEIHLQKPYKIAADKHKAYQDHYTIPAASTLIIPIRKLGEETACDIRWLENGQLHIRHNVVFINENLVPVDLFEDEQLFALWKEYSNALNEPKS